MVKKVKFDFRDVSSGFQKIRQFLLGRKYKYHNRFPPLISPRSIPPPDVPRGPEVKYANHWYTHRNVLNSVKPPVVAPVAEGKPKGKKVNPCYVKSDASAFSCPPTPGPPWWFDGHCYYEFIETSAKEGCPPPNPCEQPPSKPCPPPCPQKKEEPPKCTPPPKPCDPCKPPPPQEGCR